MALSDLSRRISGKQDGHPEPYLLELAGMAAEAAKEFVSERIESGLHTDFWFEREHSSWLLYDAVCMPLAQYMAKMHERRQTSGILAKMVDGYAKHQLIMGPPPKQMLEQMLDHCWKDRAARLEVPRGRHGYGCQAYPTARHAGQQRPEQVRPAGGLQSALRLHLERRRPSA